MRILSGLKIAGTFAALSVVAACSSTGQIGSAAVTTGAATSSVVPSSQENLQATAGDSVFFATNSSTLSNQAQATLQKQATWLAKYPSVTLRIEGHCDERGTREYNLALGARRAAAAQKYLISLGVDAGRLETISYGKDRPFAVGSNAAAWAQNRRDYARVN